MVKDIQVYVVTYFNVDQGLVRSAIRRKLYIADRGVRETCNVEVNK